MFMLYPHEKKTGYSAVEKNPHKLDSMDTPHFYI